MAIRWVLALVMLLGLTACFGRKVKVDGTAGTEEGRQEQVAAQAAVAVATDAQLLEQLESAREKAKGAPGGMDEARLFAQGVQALFEMKSTDRGTADGPGVLTEADGYLDAAIAAQPQRKHEALFSRAAMYQTAGQPEKATLAYQASFEAQPSAGAAAALVALLGSQSRQAEVLPICNKALPTVGDDETRYGLLHACREHSGSNELAWAGPANVAFYNVYSQKIAAQNAAFRAQKDADRAEMVQPPDQATDDDAEAKVVREKCAQTCQWEVEKCQKRCGDKGAGCVEACTEEGRGCQSRLCSR